MMKRCGAFLRDRRGGAMLYSGGFGLMLVGSVGAMMTNYAWQEAQYEELRGALRASVSASSRLLAQAADLTVQQEIKERVAGFLRGLMPGLQVDDDDITVTHDSTTNETWVTVGGTAKYRFSNLWGGGSTQGVANLPETTVGVALDFAQYEIAVAADISTSMKNSIAGGGTRIAALRSALEAAIGVLEDEVAETPGSMAAAIVPFGHVVNVADTSGSGETAGKRRYARILTGASVTAGSVSADAKNTDRHYYDAYASYGRGLVDMTPLISKKLPITEATANWDLRQSESVDVSTLMPTANATWTVSGEDFWNGCVMARWGAYWDATARPSTWDASDLDNNASLYPASTTPAAWKTGGAALASEPLHISDAPPDHGDPNTRFTAYSFPDSSIGGTVDARMEALLKETLTDKSVSEDALGNPGPLLAVSTTTNLSTLDQMRGANDWTRTNSGGGTADGDVYCPQNPILPLTSTAATLRTHSTALTHTPTHGNTSATYLHLGVVWGVRALSPLWRSVWEATDDQGTTRPLKPCAENESSGCAENVKKIIVLLTDGSSTAGYPLHGRALHGFMPNGQTGVANLRNPGMARTNARDSLCGGNDILKTGAGGAAWKTAAQDDSPTAFNARFGGKTDSNGTFNNAAALELAADWGAIVARPASLNTLVHQAGWATLFSHLTPWQLFRGDQATIASSACSVADALAEKQPTGCTYSGSGFGLDGRPTQRPACRPNIPFGPYGNMDDFMRVGNQDVVAGAAPFQSASTWTLDTTPATMFTHPRDTLNDWFDDACAFANDRGVSIVGIYLGNSQAWTQGIRNRLEACVDAAGGRSGVQDIHVAPTKAALETAFREIFTVRPSLRFLN